MLKRICDRCKEEIQSNKTHAEVTFEHKQGSLSYDSHRNFTIDLCEKCAVVIKEEIFRRTR